MSKRTIGLVAGLAVASVAAVATPLSSALASGAGSSAAPATAASAGAAQTLHASPVDATIGGTSPFGADGTANGTAGSAAATASTGAGVVRVSSSTRVSASAVIKAVAKPAPKPAPKPPVFRVVRKVLLQLPTSAVVGSNVSGYVQVLDDNGQVQSPVPNVRVQFQRKDGARWTVLSDDVTDENGLLQVAFMSQVNVTVRAAFVPPRGTGTAIFTKTLTVSSSSQVTWAARPDMDVVAKAPVRYAFRVNSGVVPTAHLEFASSTRPTKWTPGKSVAIARTGVATATVTFPGPGTYLVRGTTGKTATNAAGYTSTITVTVS